MDGSVISNADWNTPIEPNSSREGYEYYPEVRRFRLNKVLQLVDLKQVPCGALLMTGDLGAGRQVEVEGDRTLIWSNKVYQLWRLGPGPFALRPTEAALPPIPGESHVGSMSSPRGLAVGAGAGRQRTGGSGQSRSVGRP
jgi:hypothetical protein